MGRNTNSSPIKYSASNLGCFYINCINSLSLGNGVIFLYRFFPLLQLSLVFGFSFCGSFFLLEFLEFFLINLAFLFIFDIIVNWFFTWLSSNFQGLLFFFIICTKEILELENYHLAISITLVKIRISPMNFFWFLRPFKLSSFSGWHILIIIFWIFRQNWAKFLLWTKHVCLSSGCSMYWFRNLFSVDVKMWERLL